MFDQQKAAAALEAKEKLFIGYSDQLQQDRERLALFFERFQSASFEELEAALLEQDEPWPGALPTPEWAHAERMRIPFIETWHNHREARQWALSVLYRRPSLAVDGSQITPTKDFSVPVGAVQIGWFVNEHLDANANGDAPFVKDLSFTVLAPDELGDEDDDSEGGFPNWRVNQQRFLGECDKLCELMESYADRPFDQRPLCFFDGSFAISFAGQLRPQRARPYLQAVRRLLDCSERHQVPLIGFVDSTFSQDLVTLINVLHPEARISRTSDARLLQPVLPHWGDRSPLFVCARNDQLSRNGHAGFYRQICFCYMRLVADRPPARLEMPRWLVEKEKAVDILDRVRAECVVGNGYPYVIESADAVAVIGQQDRQRFYRLFQQFLGRRGMQLSVARKLRSKQTRR